jgi:uncharacterized membrane protein
MSADVAVAPHSGERREYFEAAIVLFAEVIEMAIVLLRLNPFDIKAVLLAKHAQHVVLIHFPVALFVASVAFDLAAHWTRRRGLVDAAYYNLLGAAMSTIPVLVTGFLAWHFQLEGQKLTGILLLHAVLACVSCVLICSIWWMGFRARQRSEGLPKYQLAIESVAVITVLLTAHLGGFLSGVNLPH